MKVRLFYFTLVEYKKIFYHGDTKLNQLKEEPEENEEEKENFIDLDKYLLSPAAMTSSSRINQNGNTLKFKMFNKNCIDNENIFWNLKNHSEENSISNRIR